MCLFFYSQRQSVNSIVTSMSECELLHIYFCFFCHFIFGWQKVAGKTWWEQKIKKPENRLQKNETHKKPTWNLSLMHTNININIIYAYVWYEMAHRLDNDNEPLLLLLLTLPLFFLSLRMLIIIFPFLKCVFVFVFVLVICLKLNIGRHYNGIDQFCCFIIEYTCRSALVSFFFFVDSNIINQITHACRYIRVNGLLNRQ